jgi:hypothetical protein
VPDLPFGGLGPVLDFGEQFRLDPDTFMRDPLREGLRLPDERRQASLGRRPKLSLKWMSVPEMIFLSSDSQPLRSR